MAITEPVRIIIPGDPRTKKNSQRIIRTGGRRILIPSEAFTAYQTACGYYLRPLGIDAPVNIACRFYMATRRRVDLVNLLEAVDDILVHYGVIADDHCGIVVSHDGSSVHWDKQHPRVEIVISPVEWRWEPITAERGQHERKDGEAHDGA